jgi:hypothetical protein
VHFIPWIVGIATYDEGSTRRRHAAKNLITPETMISHRLFYTSCTV